jgi:hypothetical protein
MKFNSTYKCPNCKKIKDIYLLKCPSCKFDHSFLGEISCIVQESKSYVECRNKLNFKLNSNLSRQTITRLIDRLKINLDHFNGGRGRFYYTKEKILIKNSPANQQILKTLVQRENLLPYLCAECGNNGWWNNKPLILQLDHKNGDNKDNRLENLQYLCPNCHTQTPTYCGKKGAGKRKLRH